MTKHMHTLTKLFLIALFATPLNIQAIALSDGEEVDEIVAIVNDNLITRSELDSEITTIVNRFKQSGRELPPISAIEGQVLEKLITQTLRLDKAEKLGITVSPDMLATAIGNIAKKNGLTLSEMRNSLENEGMSFKAFRKKLETEIILSRFKNQEIINKINVSNAEIDNLLKQNKNIGKGNMEYRIQHLLIATPEGASAEQINAAHRKISIIIKRLEDGEDFGNLAVLESNGRQALEGGDLGWLKNDQLPSIFTELIADLKKGDISQPIRTSGGFHIIKLADVRGDAKSLITQTKARHILISTGEMVSDQDALTRLEQLRLRIEGGDDFATLARSHSDDKVSAIKGGDLGWVEADSVVEKFHQEMDELEIGGLSKPFRTSFGWHIVQVLDRREHDNSDKILRSEARDILIKRKAKDATDLYLIRLRDEAYVDIRLESE